MTFGLRSRSSTRSVALNSQKSLRTVLNCGLCKKNLAICNKYYEFILAFFIVFDRIFISKYIVKGNKLIVNHALLRPGQLLFHVLWQTCATFYSIGFVFYKQLKAENRLDRVVLKNKYGHGRVITHSITFFSHGQLSILKSRR